ncbi:MAG: hypothetical protein IPK76_18795 [Lewinellaceae bacterium]|nr:hypothetical protein [Lewinellaceae bacterium]
MNSISFLPNGQQIATGASDGTIKIWNLSNGKSKFTLNAGGGLADRKGVNQVSCFSNGQYLASISHDHKVKIWDLSTQKNVLNLNSDGLNEGHFSNGFAINPNASQVATSGKDKTIKFGIFQL